MLERQPFYLCFIHYPPISIQRNFHLRKVKRINQKNIVKIGFFQKPHGITGRLLLISESCWLPSLENTSVIFVESDGLPVPWFIREDGVTIHSENSALIELEWIDNEYSAKKLCGKNVFLEMDRIVPHNPGNISGEWISYQLIDLSSGYVGMIASVNDYSGNIVFSVDTPQGTCLVPFHTDFIAEINHNEKKIIMRLPDGLLRL